MVVFSDRQLSRGFRCVEGGIAGGTNVGRRLYPLVLGSGYGLVLSG